ncbi:hypothetical protein SAMN02983003_1654 [Devosia enhydra]|uniref:Uncharacterized protein n=2 Tax=Devosia enhydra TaxID=665118 RepID=A0A1K2HWM7_9HYPH|nr:hypothetical protein SAMN02983003_1654 [Devosia enhydra]
MVTERELFAAFIELAVHSSTNFGPACSNESYEPISYLKISDEYDDLEDASELIIERLTEADKPEEYLHSLANCMDTYANTLRKVLADFHSFKRLHSIEAHFGAEPKDQGSQAWQAWSDAWDEHDRHPRFLAPAVTEGALV